MSQAFWEMYLKWSKTKTPSHCLGCINLFNLEIITVRCNYDKFKKKINNKKNKGIGITRNIGVAKATGEYIGFVDADDYVEKDMYEKYYNYAKEHNLDLLTSDYFKIIKPLI